MVFVQQGEETVKENKLSRAPLSAWWLAAALAASGAALAGVALIDESLPAPLGDDAPPTRFRGLHAHKHLVNLTAMGPRVAGSYENEVLAVSVLVTAIKRIADQASPHNRIELDVHSGSGAFPLSFMDGMTNVYRGVQSVVGRVRGAGGRPAARSALLLNCHFDTVPDSPGASDDGAGCAVLLEVMRALSASPYPLRHDAVFLFNGAEENILQASHAFITQHKWAKDIRAFINIEACGAGGREVLFQAGPYDPWIVETYAGVVPHPFASSLAQELFESGIIPADTDFRIFRDFGKLSGVDLAWSSNGYVYHTRLDTHERVPPAALQRTGDNVLALTHGLLASERLEGGEGLREGQPVYFDVLGGAVVSARAPAAALLAALTATLVVCKVHVTATHARRQLYVSASAWWRWVCAAGLCGGGAAACGAACALGPALLLHAGGARLAWFARPWLLAPLFALPALGGSWWAARRLWTAPPLLRGWWAARAWHDAAALWAAALLLGCALRGLRSGFLPLLWALLPALADLAATLAGAGGGARAACWAAGAALPATQTWYLALGSLQMFVPVMGRAGSGPLPADVSMALLVAALVLAACAWMLPLLHAAPPPNLLMWMSALGACAALGAALSGVLGPPYSAERPQRLMVFHTRRTLHEGGAATTQALYWVPELDANTLRTLQQHAGEAGAWRTVSPQECSSWVWCGAPYYLPVLSLVSRSHAGPAPAPPLVQLSADVRLSRLNASALELSVAVSGPNHIVLIVSPAAGARLVHADGLPAPLASARWGDRLTYFIALHDARGGGWALRLQLQHAAGAAPGRWVDVSLAGHALAGPLAPPHAALLAALPPWVASTGWGVDLHLYSL